MELMTALNRLHGGKNIKLPYFIAQLSRYAVPKVLLRSRLEEILRDGEKRYDMDYVLDRVNYYNRLTGAERLSPTEATPLKEHKFRGRHSAYIFDSYQTTRFFDDSLRWQTYFGDGVFDLLHPTIIKARKIDRGGEKPLPAKEITPYCSTCIIGKTKCDGIQNQMRLFGGRVSPKRKATKISHTHTKKHRSNGF